MAVDVSGFVTPEQKFEGLYKVSDTLAQKKEQERQDAELKRREDEQARGRTAASMRFFSNYLDPKDRYTGTNYDPKMNELLGDALSQAYELAGKGAGEAEIMTAISPLVNKANTYQQKAKMYSEGKKQFLDAIKGQKGYNVANIGKYMDKEAFENANIDEVDPTDIMGFANKVFEKYGSDITNDEALSEYIKKIPTSQTTTDIINYNSRGGKQRNKAMVDMPNFFVKDEEDGVTSFVPKYDKATEFGEDIIGDFTDDKGNTIKAPVRLLDEKIFDNIISESPAIKHRVEALVNDALKSGGYQDSKGNPLSLNSPQAKNLGRALLYDELKNKAEIKRNIIQETKPAQVRIYNGNSAANAKNSGAEWVKRAQSSLEAGDKQAIEDVFSELLAGDMKEFKGIQDLGNGKFKITIQPNPKYNLMGNVIPDSELAKDYEFDANDRQLPYRLARLRQVIMGGDVNLERAQFERGKPNTEQPKPSGKPPIKKDPLGIL